MATERLVTRETVHRFLAALRSFATSEVRGQATVLLTAVVACLVAINALNVVNSYVGRDFITAIEQRQHDRFVREALRYVGVFAISTVVLALARFSEDRLALLWRDWLTRRIVRAYLAERTYRRLAAEGLANPDQRIAEDVRYFVTTTLSLAVLQLNASLTVLAFSGVLWSISPTLFVVGIVYAVTGSLLILGLGRPLVRLNSEQSDREADFRAALIHVREHADRVALLHRERELETRVLDRLRTLVDNMRRIIAVNRNLTLFTAGYNYLIQIIPALLVAPLFIRGEVEFGVVTQSAMAFTQLLGAFSLVVTQFPTISSYGAVLARLNALTVGIRLGRHTGRRIQTVENDRIAYEDLTLRLPEAGRVLVDRLSLSIPRGTRLVVRSQDAMVRGALMRATAGVWEDGDGRVLRPALERVAFVPERPYVPPGTLREVMTGSAGPAVSDADLHAILAMLGAEAILHHADGLDVERDWVRILSLREQTLLAVAHLAVARPQFAFVDNLGRTVGPAQFAMVLRMFTRSEISYVVMGGADVEAPCDLVLDLADDGRWSLQAGGRD